MLINNLRNIELDTRYIVSQQKIREGQLREAIFTVPKTVHTLEHPPIRFCNPGKPVSQAHFFSAHRKLLSIVKP